METTVALRAEEPGVHLAVPPDKPDRVRPDKASMTVQLVRDWISVTMEKTTLMDSLIYLAVSPMRRPTSLQMFNTSVALTVTSH